MKVYQEHPLKNNDEISLKEVVLKIRSWLKYLVSKWIIIAAFTIIGGVIGTIYYYVTTPKYKAELTFVYGESGGGQLSGLSSLASQFGLSGSIGNSGIFDGQNLMAFMQSKKIIEKVLLSKVIYKTKKISMADFYIEVYKFKDAWQKSKLDTISFNNIDTAKQFSVNQNIVLNSLYSNILKYNLVVAKKDKESGIMSMKFTSENELLSLYFINLLSENVSRYYIETKTKKAADNVRILQHQTDSVRRALASAIKGVAVSADVNPNPNPELQSLRVPSQNKQVDVQANQAILAILVQNLEVAKISLRNETPLIQPVDEPTLPLDNVKMGLSQLISLGAVAGCFLIVFCLSINVLFKNLLNSK